MAKVTMHQALDGSLHQTAKECEAHDARVRMEPEVLKFATGLAAPTNGFSFPAPDGQTHVTVQPIDMASFLVENADTLRKIFNDAQIVRRAKRGSQAAAA
jgi:hypothetical protein